MKTDWTTDTRGTGQYAEVNGIKLYYETHGAGRRAATRSRSYRT
jgi:hypothetical protein